MFKNRSASGGLQGGERKGGETRGLIGTVALVKGGETRGFDSSKREAQPGRGKGTQKGEKKKQQGCREEGQNQSFLLSSQNLGKGEDQSRPGGHHRHRKRNEFGRQGGAAKNLIRFPTLQGRWKLGKAGLYKATLRGTKGPPKRQPGGKNAHRLLIRRMPAQRTRIAIPYGSLVTTMQGRSRNVIKPFSTKEKSRGGGEKSWGEGKFYGRKGG